jgi:hypothetical protein
LRVQAQAELVRLYLKKKRRANSLGVFSTGTAFAKEAQGARFPPWYCIKKTTNERKYFVLLNMCLEDW